MRMHTHTIPCNPTHTTQTQSPKQCSIDRPRAGPNCVYCTYIPTGIRTVQALPGAAIKNVHSNGLLLGTSTVGTA